MCVRARASHIVRHLCVRENDYAFNGTSANCSSNDDVRQRSASERDGSLAAQVVTAAAKTLNGNAIAPHITHTIYCVLQCAAAAAPPPPQKRRREREERKRNSVRAKKAKQKQQQQKSNYS